MPHPAATQAPQRRPEAPAPLPAWRRATAAFAIFALAACAAAPTDPDSAGSPRGPRRLPAASGVATDSTQFDNDSTGRGGGGYIDPNH